MNFERPQPIRLVIAHPHSILRDGLRRLLERDQNHKVIVEGSDGAEAVKLALLLEPDILLLYTNMPKQTGWEALRELSIPANATPVRVILLTAGPYQSETVEALQLGARGVVPIDSSPRYC